MLRLLLVALAIGRALSLRPPVVSRLRDGVCRAHSSETFPPVSTAEGAEARWRVYKDSHDRSLQDDEFWGDCGRRLLTWFSPFVRVSGGDLLHGDVRWFTEGKLNACFNCVDRHLPQRADQVPPHTPLPPS